MVECKQRGRTWALWAFFVAVFLSASRIQSAMEQGITTDTGDDTPRKLESLNNNLLDPQLQQFPPLSSANTKVIFYHVYLPPDNIANAHRIIREQLGQLGGKEKDVTLLYNTIGDANGLTKSLATMQEWCQEYNLTACHHLNHFETGMEDITLQGVYDFCEQEPTQRVGYVHNKGSHHQNPLNEIWRFLMTETIVKDECWSMAREAPKDQCNVCGLYFTSDWGVYMAGNVWTADCSYVNQLIPPKDFEAESMQVFRDAVMREKLGQLRFTVYDMPPVHRVGIGRYSAEWWIASHPRVQPCDFSPSVSARPHKWDPVSTRTFLDWMVNNKKAKDDSPERRRSMLSNFTTDAPALPYVFSKKYEKGMSDGDMKREYFLLPGRIHRWLQLYGQLPGEDSWAWKHYPQGDFWKTAVADHGVQVLEKVLPLGKDIATDVTLSSVQ